MKELCLEIISSCPMNCIHCSNNSALREKLEFSEIKSVIDDFTFLGGQILEMSGGEPLEHSELLEIINYAKEKGLETRLYTSGQKSEREEIVSITQKLAKDLKESGLDEVIFNIQGAKSATHDHITGLKGSYKRVLASIKEMASVGCSINVHFVPIKLNYRELEKSIDICSILGVSEFAILRFVSQGRGFKNRNTLELSYQEHTELFSVLNKVKTNNQLKIRIGHPLNCFIESDSEDSECLAGRSICLIKPNGDVVPCPAFKQSVDYVAGNIKENSLIDIWFNSEILQKLRTFKYEDITGCRNCISLSKCRGGCTAQRILTWGDLYRGGDPLCLGGFSELPSSYSIPKPSTKVLCPSSTIIQE